MLKKIALMLALPFALAMSTLAVAQSNPPTPPPFAALGGQTAISATNASSRVALPASTSAFGAITVYNASTTVDAYVALGDVTVVALNSGGVCAAPTFTMCLVKAGTSIVIWASGNTYIAGITSSSTASLVIYQGSGGVQLSAIYSGTSPPSGPAGGDLSGTYPNPTVALATNGLSTNAIKDLSATSRLTWTATNPTVIRDQNAAAVVSIGSATVAINGCTPGSNAVCAAGTGQMTGLGINGAPVSANLISIYNATPAERVEIGINGSSIGLGLGSGGQTLWGPNAAPGSYDTGISRDSVLGALNLDLGNGTANDKTGTLNAAKVALGGCTIGTDNFCITGPMSVSGQSKFLAGVAIGSATTAASQGVSPSGSTTNVNGGGSGALVHLQDNSGNVYLEATTGLATFGGPAAAAPTAQTIAVQSVLAGTSNTAGVVTTIKNSAGTGTALGGNTVFQYAPHDQTHAVTTFTGSASPYTIGFTAGNITTYPVGTVMTVSGCTTATLNGTYTVTASSSGSVTATTSATGTGSPTTCLIVGNTSQNAFATALTINGDTAAASFVGTISVPNSAGYTITTGTDGIFNSTGLYMRGDAGVLHWAPSSNASASADTGFSRDAAGVIDAGTGAQGSTAGSLKFASYIAGGTAPVPTGTCTRGTQTGGLTAGSIVLTCSAQTLILTFTTTAPNGWMCEAIDQTTTADTMKQTSNTTTSCTLTGTTAASDVVIYQARAY